VAKSVVRSSNQLLRP